MLSNCAEPITKSLPSRPKIVKRGVISYSSGNHAQGVAYAARALGVKAIIVMPDNAPAIKREATAALGAEIVIVGPGSAERQTKAEELAAQHGYVIVPPYNDEQIIAGQGTMGLEILEDLPEVETVFAPVGGGGMISGVAAAIKLSRPSIKVIGVEPELAGDAQASLRAGKIVHFKAEDVSRTIADGLRTQSIGPINFEHIRRYVDDIVTVSEEEIRRAVRLLASNPATVAEPSGAVAVAGFCSVAINSRKQDSTLRSSAVAISIPRCWKRFAENKSTSCGRSISL